MEMELPVSVLVQVLLKPTVGWLRSGVMLEKKCSIMTGPDPVYV